MAPCERITLYSHVNKYFDTEKVIILAVYHSILEFKLNNEYEPKVQTLRVFTSKLGDRLQLGIAAIVPSLFDLELRR